MKLAQLLDQARARSNVSSDYAIAKRLAVSRQTVSQWRSGAQYPATAHIFDLAEMAGRNPALVIAELELERDTRAGHSDQAATWQSRLQRLAGATAAAVVMGTMGSAPAPAAAAGQAGASAGAPLYIMTTKRRRRSWLSDLLQPRVIQFC